MCSTGQTFEMNEASALKLTDLFSILRSHKFLSSQTSSNQDTSQIQYYELCHKRFQDYANDKKSVDGQYDKFVPLIREFVMTHQWSRVLPLVNALADFEKRAPLTLWKAGLICLMMQKDRHLVENFVRKSSRLKGLFILDAMLELRLYLLRHGHFEVARDLQQDYHLSAGTLHVAADRLNSAYNGLAHFMTWAAGLHQQEAASVNRSSADLIRRRFLQDSQHTALKAMACNVRSAFSKVLTSPGVWDVFILKLMQIMEHYSQHEEAWDLLAKYRDLNPENPNAHRFLCEFLSSRKEDRATKISCMKKVIILDPSNPLAPKLCDETEAEDPVAAIHVMFDYLDFAHCWDDQAAWTRLETALASADPKQRGVIQKCWSLRRDWWPFTALLQYGDDDLAKCKARVLGRLLTL